MNARICSPLSNLEDRNLVAVTEKLMPWYLKLDSYRIVCCNNPKFKPSKIQKTKAGNPMEEWCGVGKVIRIKYSVQCIYHVP